MCGVMLTQLRNLMILDWQLLCANGTAIGIMMSSLQTAVRMQQLP
jgi:hypothetical protein